MKNREITVLLIVSIISIVLLSNFLYKKNRITHKQEINRLLQAKDISKNNTNEKYSLINEYSKEDNEIESKDFITGIENRQQTANESDKSLENKNEKYNKEDIDYNTFLLARLINSEAGDEPYEGKVAVANVVLYRSQKENQSIKDIIYASGQFDGVHTSIFAEYPSDESLNAAVKAMNGDKAIENAYYFANLNLCSPSWAKEKSFICRIGDHWFFKE